MHKTAVIAALCLILAACSSDPCSPAALRSALDQGTKVLQSGDYDAAQVTFATAAQNAAQCAAAEKDPGRNAQDRMFEAVAYGQQITALRSARRESYDLDQIGLLEKRVKIERDLAADNAADIPDAASAVSANDATTIKQNAAKSAQLDAALLATAKASAKQNQYIQMQVQASEHP